MKKQRATKKPSVADLLVSSPLPTSSPNRTTSESPQRFEFNLNNNAFNTNNNNNNISISNMKKKSNSVMQPTTPSVKSLSTISDLKELASSRLDSIKRQLDHSQSEIVKDIEASQSRLHKRLKVSPFLSLSLYIYAYQYIYIHTHEHRFRRILPIFRRRNVILMYIDCNLSIYLCRTRIL